jgi:hypothetical protein
MSSFDYECGSSLILKIKLELVDCISPTLDDEASLVDSSDGLLHSQLQCGFYL